MDFREELNKITEKRNRYFFAEKRNGETILKEVVIPYFKYVSLMVQQKREAKIIFDLFDYDILEIRVEADSHPNNDFIYYNRFKNKEVAMKTMQQIQKIFEEQNFNIKVDDNPILGCCTIEVSVIF